MKNITLIIVTLFIISCNKDSNPSESDPRIYNLNLELVNSEGNAYRNGDIEISGNTFARELDQIIDEQYPWFGLGKIENEATQDINSILFGGPCEVQNCPSEFVSLPFASGAEVNDVGENETLEKDKYWLLRYGNDDVDTLRVNDVMIKNPYSRNFKFFINGEEIEANNFIFDEFAVKIQK